MKGLMVGLTFSKNMRYLHWLRKKGAHSQSQDEKETAQPIPRGGVFIKIGLFQDLPGLLVPALLVFIFVPLPQCSQGRDSHTRLNRVFLEQRKLLVKQLAPAEDLGNPLWVTREVNRS